MDMLNIWWIPLLLAFVKKNLQSQGFPATEVESCPTTKESWYRAGFRLNCSEDENNKLQYLCIPNEKKTTLLEFCYDKIMGLYEKENSLNSNYKCVISYNSSVGLFAGNCLYLRRDGFLDTKNCSAFVSGCPQHHYLSSTLYQFSSCLKINKEKRCYLAEPDCLLNSSMNDNMAHDSSITTGHSNYSTAIENTTKGQSNDSTVIIEAFNRTSSGWITAVVCVVIYCLVLFIVVIFIRRRKPTRGHTDHAIRYSQVKQDDSEGWPSTVKQYRNKLMLSQKMADRDMIWRKNGDRICESRDKYVVDCGDLFILNLTKEDEGVYQGFEETHNLKTKPIKLEIHYLTLFRRTVVTGIFRQDSIFNTICYTDCIWDSKIQENSPCEILITQNAIMGEEPSQQIRSIFTTFDGDQKLVFHAAVLLSTNCSLIWNIQEINEACNVFMKNPSTVRANQNIAYPWIDRTVEEWRTAAAQWNDSLVFSPEDVIFVNDDVEWETLSVMFQNSLAPRELLNHIFEKKLTKVLLKYFRLAGYQRQENETCVFLPTKFHERFLECIVSDYFSNCHTESMEDVTKIKASFDLRSTTHLGYIFSYFLHTGVLSEKFVDKYFCTFGYEMEKDERCICLPSELTERLIEVLGMKIILHKTIKDDSSHSLISEKLQIPEEILQWGYEARTRFLENLKRGSSPMYRARCLIVGCAGAGKTTVLHNLRRNSRVARTDTEGTIGMEVYEDVFDIGEIGEHSTLLDSNRSSKDICKWKKGCWKNEIETEGTISVMDFAGQMAYYACHQIYLSRRAMYLLVIDMAKDIQSEVGSNERHNVKDSLFEYWTFYDYYTFWLQSILTYCGHSRENSKSVETPVIVIATHKDCIEHGADDFPMRLREDMPKNLHKVFNHRLHRYHEVGLPPRRKSKEQLTEIEEIRCRIAETAKLLPHWGERVPIKWSDFEMILRQKKEQKILSWDEIKNSRGLDFFVREDELKDMLRFYHEIGMILFFPDEHLRDVIIIDIQWFVDAFKHIITDKKQNARAFILGEEWHEFYENGIITESLILAVWKEKVDRISYSLYEKHKNKIMLFMEKLGILAKIDADHYYIPSMNKRDLDVPTLTRDWEKTSILSFYFLTFLPHFFFYRLVVACFSIWKPIQDKMTKNASLFTANEAAGNYIIAVAVNKTSIQLQIYNKSNSVLDTEKIIQIRTQIHNMIDKITTSFHRGVEYEIGFHCQCKSVVITEDDENYFIREDKLMNIRDEHTPCPLSGNRHNKTLTKGESLRFWK